MQRSGAQACRAIPAICASVLDIAYRVVVLLFICLFIYLFIIFLLHGHIRRPVARPRITPATYTGVPGIVSCVGINVYLFIYYLLLHVGAHCTSGPRTQPAASWGPAENYPRTGNLRRRPRYGISCVGVNVYLFICLFIVFFIVYCVVVCLRLCGSGRTQAGTYPSRGPVLRLRPQCASRSLISHIVTLCLCSL